MGLPVLILGESGSGKSASLRNFPADKVAVLNVASKPLPFRSELMVRNGVTYDSINASLKKNAMKAYVIDDAQYLMSFEFFAHAREAGYQKYTNLGKNFYDMLENIRVGTSNDTIVYLLSHIEQSDGKYKMKTIGKMLDEKCFILQNRSRGQGHQAQIYNAVGRHHNGKIAYGNVRRLGDRQ